MLELIYAVVGLIIGGVIVGLLMHYRARGVVQEKVAEAEARARTTEGTVIELRNQFNYTGAELEKVRALLDEEVKRRVAAETQLEENRKSIEEQRRLLEEAKVRLTDTFKALSVDALRGNTQEFIQKADDVLKPMKETLTRYESALQEMERTRAGAYEGLTTHLQQLATAHRALQQQTTKLEQALRAPTVRGKWGEITLQRVVELAGLSQYCDFDTQTTADSEESRQRPDLVVRLPGNRSIVVDAKVPLDAYMDAMETDDADTRSRKLVDHAAAVREQVRQLSKKSYWSQFDTAPEFVILFLPGESFFSAALEGDRSLIDDGIRNRVILATPTTLIMALLTVAHSWQQQQLAENARRIADAGTALYNRLCVFTRHLADIRKGIERTAAAYNDAVGSWEQRVEPGVRQLKELGAAGADQELPELRQTDAPLRQLPPADGGNDADASG
ncbi:MAG TPA: DNA recombination protein RmuC [Planctomycetota bacterium]|nr:DNA recombination protein RmuC [Planctomycetota bacterium]